ncbi:hypothetical protein GQ53DRAFT_833224 [Thozetella sp. PMI_491]|nr:hypothetical protein GQ53DRAFT_833224 [Thozetella sp. PMI_491]
MLQNKFRGFASGSPSTLIILYYQGHGGLDSHGHLKLSNGAGEKMHWSEIANAIVDAPCDVLTILNCCHAGAAARARVPARPNYEQHLKELIMATSVEAVSGWGTACNFAPCLEQALRERRTDWEQGFNGTPYHWMQAINRNMEKKRASARVNHVDLVKPPSNARQRPIILAPRQLC